MYVGARLSDAEPTLAPVLGPRIGIPVVEMPLESSVALPWDWFVVPRPGGWQVMLRAELAPPAHNWSAALGIARALSAADATVEECGRLAGTLAAPMRAVEHALRIHGADSAAFARYFTLPESVAAWRLRQCLARPFAFTAATPRAASNVA